MRARTSRAEAWRALKISVGAILVAIVAAYFFPKFPPMVELARTPCGPLIDSRWDGYTAADVHQLFACYGESGRTAYAGVNTIDFGFAATYAITLAVALHVTGRHLVPHAVARRAVTLLPIVAGGADIIENTIIRTSLEAFPAVPSETLIGIATTITWTKWRVGLVAAVLALAFAVLTVLLIAGKLDRWYGPAPEARGRDRSNA